jgi:transcriptional regulator with XRE-family HTH domain
VRFNYSKLRGRIKEICGTEQEFARRIKIGRVSLSKRLNNEIDFSRKEMLAAAKVLEFDYGDLTAYFFTEEVQKHEHHAADQTA